MRELYTARAILERDYAAKLQGLARKAAEKQSKLSPAVSVGTDPSKAWDGNIIKQKYVHLPLGCIGILVLTICNLNSSAISAYDAIIESIAKSAQCHIDYADQLTSQTIDTLKAIEKCNDAAKQTVRHDLY